MNSKFCQRLSVLQFCSVSLENPLTVLELPPLQNSSHNFLESLDDEVVRRAVRDIRPGAELYLKMGGSNFESQLKKYKRETLDQ